MANNPTTQEEALQLIYMESGTSGLSTKDNLAGNVLLAIHQMALVGLLAIKQEKNDEH